MSLSITKATAAQRPASWHGPRALLVAVLLCLSPRDGRAQDLPEYNPKLPEILRKLEHEIDEHGAHFAPLRIKATTNLEHRWSTGRSIPICYLKVHGEGDFLPFGDSAILGRHIAGGEDSWRREAEQLGALLYAADAAHPDALAHPTGWIWRGDDHGSGNPNDISYWEPVPPAGYVAMGLCWNGGPGKGDRPDVNKYWCVREDYTRVVGVETAWSDGGQGFKSHNLNLNRGVFTTDTERLPREVLFIPPLFTSVGWSGTPRALVLKKCVMEVEPIDPPDWWCSVKRINQGSTSTPGVLCVAVVPYVTIEDVTLKGQAKKSPFYFLLSEPYWICQGLYSGGRKMDVESRVGTEIQDSRSFRKKTGFSLSITMGFETEFSEGLDKVWSAKEKLKSSFSTTLSKEFETTTKQTETRSTADTVRESLTFPDLPPGALQWSRWQRMVKICCYRLDGTPMEEASFANANHMRLQVREDGSLAPEGSR